MTGQRRGNVLVIVVDQLRWDCLGCFGNPDVRTPNIDRLSVEGIRYSEVFCASPICVPSRHSLMTGLPVHEHLGRENSSTLGSGHPTFARELRAHGYRTAAVGKMHLTPTYLDVGFDQLLLAEQDGEGRFDDDYHRDLRRHGLLDVIDLCDQRDEYRRRAPRRYWDTFGAIPSNLPVEWHSTTWIADRALEAIERWGDDSELLMVSFVKPHHPFDPPEPWADIYPPEELTLLPGWTDEVSDLDGGFQKGYFRNTDLTERALRRVMAYYYATITQIDHHIGRFIAALRDRGVYDDTTIMFVSDHGEFLGFHHLLLKGNYMYDPLVRTPVILKPPRRMPGGWPNSDALLSNTDLGAMLLRGAAGPVPDGHWSYATPSADGREIVFAQVHRHRPHYMARSRTHKLLVSRTSEGSLFFDLREDPYEVAPRDPSVTAADELLDRLHDWFLFEHVPLPYRDPGAPRIEAPNVPTSEAAHRESMRGYVEEKFLERLAMITDNSP